MTKSVSEREKEVVLAAVRLALVDPAENPHTLAVDEDAWKEFSESLVALDQSLRDQGAVVEGKPLKASPMSIPIYYYVVTLLGGEPCFATLHLRSAVEFAVKSDDDRACRPRLYRLEGGKEGFLEVDLRELNGEIDEASLLAERLFNSRASEPLE